MQDRYAGDIGDYIKFALLRHIAWDMTLGVAWYLYPDESHNADGKHVAYLSQPDIWERLDPELFHALKNMVADHRSTAALQQSGILAATYAGAPLNHALEKAGARSATRRTWFDATLDALKGCDLVFADPDNGLIDDREERRRQRHFGKQMPLSEALELSSERTTVIYHHNTRFAGGHDSEVEYWIDRLGRDTIAVRANAYSCRTFFILNPTPKIVRRVENFCQNWQGHKVRLHTTR